MAARMHPGEAGGWKAVMKGPRLIEAWNALNNTIRGYWSRAFGQKEVILVAEGDPAMRKDLVDVLRHQHYRTMEACDGTEAVRKGARRQIDLLMTGLRLPDLVGWELTELLRLDHPALAVVYIASNHEDWWRLGRKKFKSALLKVPFRPETVLEVVRRGLDTHRELNSRLRLVDIQRYQIPH